MKKIELNSHPLGKANIHGYGQTLCGHQRDTVISFMYFLKQESGSVRAFCKRWAIEYNHFVQNMLFVCYFHDVGKLIPEFQRIIRLAVLSKWDSKSAKFRNCSHIPHPYFSLRIIIKLHKLIKPILNHKQFVEVFAILGHHTQIHKRSYQNMENRKLEPDKILITKNDIRLIIEDFQQLLNELNLDFNFNFEEISIENDFKNLTLKETNRIIRNFVFYDYEFKEDNFDFANSKFNLKSKAVYTYILSILKTCDSIASANFTRYTTNLPDPGPKPKILESIISYKDLSRYYKKIDYSIVELIRRKNLYEYQSILSENKKTRIILNAPCGRGKTEASLLWAINICKQYNKERIIYAMPTQVTSNSLFKRFSEEYFGEENTGLYHSNSIQKILPRVDSSEEKHLLTLEESDENQEKYVLTQEEANVLVDKEYQSCIYRYPITITTIDHLILSLVNSFSSSSYACGMMQNSVIIFDEVHYYEILTLSHILNTLKILNAFDIPHLVMTATLPRALIQEINTNDEYEIIRDEKGQHFKPFYLKRVKEKLTSSVHKREFIRKLSKTQKQNKSQILLFNTVRKARDAYLELKRQENKYGLTNIFLFHSQFTNSDRRQKENSLQKFPSKYSKSQSFILVATQIIEIGLDISCDIMYTELAPLDALAQRGGRLNRKSKFPFNDKGNCTMEVYDYDFFLPYDEQNLLQTNKLIEEGPISYKQFNELINRLYKSFTNISDELFFALKESTIIGEKSAVFDEEHGRNLKIREDNYRKIDVVPISCMPKLNEEYEKLEKYKASKDRRIKYPFKKLRTSLIKDFQVKIPYKIFRENRFKFEWDERKFLIMNMEYSDDIGVIYD